MLSKGQRELWEGTFFEEERTHRPYWRGLELYSRGSEGPQEIFQVTQKKSDMILGESASKAHLTGACG